MVDIRPLTDADIDAVAAVHVRAWQAGYAGIMAAGYLAGLDPAVFARHRRERAGPPGSQTLVAVDAGVVIGFASFGPYRVDGGEGYNPRAGELYAIYVDPDRWGAGTGRRLLAAARAGLAAAGERHLFTPRGGTEQLAEVRYAGPL